MAEVGGLMHHLPFIESTFRTLNRHAMTGSFALLTSGPLRPLHALKAAKACLIYHHEAKIYFLEAQVAAALNASGGDATPEASWRERHGRSILCLFFGVGGAQPSPWTMRGGETQERNCGVENRPLLLSLP